MSVQAATDYAASLVRKGRPFGDAVHQAAGRFAIDYGDVQRELTRRSATRRQVRQRRALLQPVTRTATTPAPAQVYYGPRD